MPYATLLECRQRASTFRWQGHELAYWQAGEGETLVLIHGFPSAAWDWHKLWSTLSRRYRVLAIDMLGYGLSDKPHPHEYSLLQQADMIVAWLTALGVEDYHLLCHDYGDSVGQELLARQAAGGRQGQVHVQSLCFLNGGLFPESHRPLLTQKLLRSALGPVISRFIGKASLARSFTRIFGAQTPPAEGEIDILWQFLNEHQGRRVIPALLKYLDERVQHRNRWLTAMQNSREPLAFINGTQDPISGAHMLARYRELIGEQHTYSIDVGHYPQIEAPDQVLEYYQAFRASL